MALSDYLATLDALAADATAAFTAASTPDAVEAARVEFLGAKSGRIKSAQKGLGTVAGPDKPAAGKRFNEAKQAIEAAFAAAEGRVASLKSAGKAGPMFDRTLPGVRARIGHLHP